LIRASSSDGRVLHCYPGALEGRHEAACLAFSIRHVAITSRPSTEAHHNGNAGFEQCDERKPSYEDDIRMLLRSLQDRLLLAAFDLCRKQERCRDVTLCFESCATTSCAVSAIFCRLLRSVGKISERVTPNCSKASRIAHQKTNHRGRVSRVPSVYRGVDDVSAPTQCYAKLGMNRNQLFSLFDHTLKA
jgi:hypothetical protein